MYIYKRNVENNNFSTYMMVFFTFLKCFNFSTHTKKERWLSLALTHIDGFQVPLSILLPKAKRTIKRQLYSEPFTFWAASFIFQLIVPGITLIGTYYPSLMTHLSAEFGIPSSSLLSGTFFSATSSPVYIEMGTQARQHDNLIWWRLAELSILPNLDVLSLQHYSMSPLSYSSKNMVVLHHSYHHCPQRAPSEAVLWWRHNISCHLRVLHVRWLSSRLHQTSC